MGLALTSGAPLLGCLLIVAVDRVLGARAASAAAVRRPAATPPQPRVSPVATAPACFVPAPATGSTPVRRRRRTPEEQVAETILGVGCDREVVDRVMARAAALGIDGSTMWLWTHVHGVTGLVLALDAGLRHEELCEHLDSGREPDWGALSVLAGLAADLRSTESCLAAFDRDERA